MLKSKMFSYFTFKNMQCYIDVLQKLINSYNATHHQSVGMAPNDVNSTNKHVIHSWLYKRPSSNRKYAGIMSWMTTYA